MNISVSPIHFEDFSGVAFERLVFSYVLNLMQWSSIQWLGQSGGDGGRDIWGESGGKTYCYQCANREKLTFEKVQTDLHKLTKNGFYPEHFILVSGGKISASLRQKIGNLRRSVGINSIDCWSGVEFEERLRKDFPELLRRFNQGEAFPDAPGELLKYIRSFSLADDEAIVSFIVESFDRPAFTTPFQHESSIPNFEKAIFDTIALLNTGIHSLTDGTTIRTMPSRHRVTNPVLKQKLASLTNLVVLLRDKLISLKNSKDIEQCKCGIPDCPVYVLSQHACQEMDNVRELIFATLNELKPENGIRLVHR